MTKKITMAYIVVIIFALSISFNSFTSFAKNNTTSSVNGTNNTKTNKQNSSKNSNKNNKNNKNSSNSTNSTKNTTQKQKISDKNKKDVYIFSREGCPFCAKLEEDLNDRIIKSNPNINFVILKIENNENFNLLRKFVMDRNIKGNIGLPMVFIGDNYFMGWGSTDLENLFNVYIKEYVKK